MDELSPSTWFGLHFIATGGLMTYLIRRKANKLRKRDAARKKQALVAQLSAGHIEDPEIAEMVKILQHQSGDQLASALTRVRDYMHAESVPLDVALARIGDEFEQAAPAELISPRINTSPRYGQPVTGTPAVTASPAPTPASPVLVRTAEATAPLTATPKPATPRVPAPPTLRRASSMSQRMQLQQQTQQQQQHPSSPSPQVVIDDSYTDEHASPGLVNADGTMQKLTKRAAKVKQQAVADKVSPVKPGAAGATLTAKDVTFSFQDKSLQELPAYVYTEGLNLTILDLRNNRMQAMHPHIGQLQKLQLLDLSYNFFPNLPAEMAKLTELVALDIGHNPFMELPSVVCELRTLRELFAYHLHMHTLPDELAQLEELTDLHIYDNPLQIAPAVIFQLSNLQTLNMNNCALTEVPKDLARLPLLNELHLTHNQIQRIDEEVFESSSNLHVLSLDHNLLSEIPAVLPRQLHSLEVLTVQNNNLTTLPATLRVLQLLELNICNNPMSQSDVEEWENVFGVHSVRAGVAVSPTPSPQRKKQ
eukprot:TRINITY_DN9097_c0_g1_i1.p1 TRINITY_DN9097_c0_g1~~TRINITY_DN9097_c0_g1_i1.p1  ORF type:complete len:535 (+),score=148.27 TRINITY_DN9097_c0_g1_i1:67-1671(+)